MSVTIKDVARAASVSTTTVSYVLNGKGNVSEETRKRVQKVMKELGYKRQGRAVGDIVLLYADDRFQAHAQEAQAVGAEMGFSLHFIRCDAEAEEPTWFVPKHRVAGVLIYGGLWRQEFLENVASQYFTVLLGASLRDPGIDAVWIDNSAALFHVTTSLLRDGHTQIGFINGPSASSTSAEKHIGFVQATQRFGSDVTSVIVEAESFTKRAGRLAAARLLATGHDFSAVVCGDVTLAHGLISEFHSQNPGMLQRLSIITFETDPHLCLLHDDVTVIYLPMADIIREAIQRLVHRLNRQDLGGRRVLLQPQIRKG